MNHCMKDIRYETDNFNLADGEVRHPLRITEKWYYYRLDLSDDGSLICQRDQHGNPIKSPRRLRDMCINTLVFEPRILNSIKGDILPSNCYPLMLTEAIYHREGLSIVWLVSTWPMKVLRVYDVTPLEDFLEDAYLTKPCEGSSNDMSLLDYFVLGLLKLKPESNLKTIDFTRFEKDRKLVKELCRLPILWMKPSDRTVENIHEHMTQTIEISKDKVQRFLNRISAVYCNLDGEFKHGNKIEPMNIELDLQVVIDDVPIGLSLQDLSPFKFKANKLWMKSVPEVTLSLDNITKVIDVNMITHFEYVDAFLPQNNSLFALLIHTLGTFKSLVVLSLQNSIDIKANQQMASSLNKALRKLRFIERVNLSYCNLVGRVSTLLGRLQQRFTYLNLKDCRLNEEDLSFLSHWKGVQHIKELDLSCNNLRTYDEMIMQMLRTMKQITCFSISHCQLTTHSLALIARECKECSKLKVICMQGYTPLPQEGTLELLSICAQIRSLQKVVIFPQVYGFPGNNEQERDMNRYHTYRFSYRYLMMRGRADLDLEE